MKKVKETRAGNKRHWKYFEKSGRALSIGTASILASIAMLLWTWFIWWSYLFYILGFVLFPVGIVLFVIGSVGISSDEDIDHVVSRLSAEADLDPERDAAIIQKQLKRPSPEVISGYDYSVGVMFKKAKKSNIVRTEIFKKATLVALEDSLYVSYVSVNIPMESAEKAIFEIPYCKIEDIRVAFERRTVRFLKNSFSVKDSRLEIISEGERVLSLPASESATLDFFISEVKSRRE